jgi:hypothetical protein
MGDLLQIFAKVMDESTDQVKPETRKQIRDFLMKLNTHHPSDFQSLVTQMDASVATQLSKIIR